MNEVLADLYADTGDSAGWPSPTAFNTAQSSIRWPGAKTSSPASTAIPRCPSSSARWCATSYTGNEADGTAARFFWDRVVEHHSFATGGHGKDEYFGPPDKLNDRVDGRTAETCNVYNMLKMTRQLFALSPDIRYAEFHERALFNHILASIDPEDGRTCYMVPVGRGVAREYQDMFGGFHLLRRLGHGEPCAARRRDLLRVGRPAVGEPLCAFHGRVEVGGCEADDGDDVSRGRIGHVEDDARVTQAVHPGLASSLVGRRGVRRARSTARPCQTCPRPVRTSN